MERGKRQSWSSFFGGTGFYIALALCVMVTGVAGYFALFGGRGGEAEDVNANVEDVVESPVEQQPAEMPEASAPPETEAAAELTPDPKPVQVITPAVEPSEDLETVEAQAPSIVVAPLAGETVSAFSMEALEYNETLGDWRTHDGIDIAAAAGTPVAAASGGTVLSVTDDDLLGVTVVLSHPDGYETTYGSLQADVTVSEGESVSAGEAIGAVGNTSLTESALGAHLHFSVTKDGAAVDPADYLPGT